MALAISRSKKIVFVCKYSPTMASTRYRVLQYVPLFKADGWETDVRFHDSDLFLRASRYKRLIKRLNVLYNDLKLTNMKGTQVVWFHKHIPKISVLRILKAKHFRIFLDMDDTFFASVSGQYLPEKFRFLVEASKYIDAHIVVSRFLKDYLLGKLQCPVHVIPTALNTHEYEKNIGKVQNRLFGMISPVVIGWSGSNGLCAFMSHIVSALENVYFEQGGAILYKIVSSNTEQLQIDCPISYEKWTKNRDISHLGEFDIGIMPLPNNIRTQGKGGFKILRYMASGVPAVASSVGENTEIINNGYNGILADSPQEWESALKELVKYPSLRKQLQVNGLVSVRERYERDAVFKKVRSTILANS